MVVPRAKEEITGRGSLKAPVFPCLEVIEKLRPLSVVPNSLRATFFGHRFVLDSVMNRLPIILDVIGRPQIKKERHVIPVALREIRLDCRPKVAAIVITSF
jgi:hypothetical protein